MLKKLKTLIRPLAGTPFHPQWLYERGTPPLLNALENIDANAVVLDIGCFNKWAAAHLPHTCYYIGLDYYETATKWYASVPDVFGDAAKLPLADGAIDTVLLIDVLEHLTNCDQVMSEIRRVLASDGKLILKVPFLYPLHDEPRDFGRFTIHGLRKLAENHGFEITFSKPIGHPVETAALLGNLALSKIMIDWMKTRSPAALFVALAPVIFLANNMFARLIGIISSEDHYMPFSYQLTLHKSAKQIGADG